MSLDELLRHAPPHPQHVVYLTEETTKTLFCIGAGDLVVGVSCYTVRPVEAQRRLRVSSFLDANFDKIIALQPDLVLGFSDLQADIARELAKRGVPVYIFNQRSVAEVLQSIRTVAALVGRAVEGDGLADSLIANLRRHEAASALLPRRPRVFFEEWPDPLISSIRWVSELVELAGGDEICAHTRTEHSAKGRIVTIEDVAAANPEVIIASWCGKKAVRATIAERPALAAVRAVVDDQLYEVKSDVILQPGPAALGDGIDQLARIIHAVARGEKLAKARDDDLRDPGVG